MSGSKKHLQEADEELPQKRAKTRAPPNRTRWVDLVEGRDDDGVQSAEHTTADSETSKDADYLSPAFVDDAMDRKSASLPRKSTLSKRELFQLEAEKTRKGLATSIATDTDADADTQNPSSAMRMMRMMGYDPTAKDNTAPILPDLSRQMAHKRAGIGRTTSPSPAEVQQKRAAEQQEKRQAALNAQEDDYRSRIASAQKEAAYRKLAQEAQRIWEELESKMGAVDEDQQPSNLTHSDEEEADLPALLATLRSRHFYCVFCGCQYDSADDLQASCPGADELDHD